MTTTYANAILVENGSSFTGKYKALDESCQKKVFNYQTGQNDLDPIFFIEGTAEGLKVDGNLRPVVNGDIQNAQPNSNVTQKGGYLSATEYRLDGVLHFERISPSSVGRFSEDYKIDAQGNITFVTSDTNGTPERNKSCYLTRVN